MLPAQRVIASKYIFPQATAVVSDLSTRLKQPVVLHGWLHRRAQRLAKSLTFGKLRDQEGKLVQIVDTHNQLGKLKMDSSIAVEGIPRTTNSGDIEVSVSKIHVLNEANNIPTEIAGAKSWPPEYRYIQLRQPNLQSVIRKRAAIVRTARKILDDHRFTEVETPLLFKSTPEGAREFLVPTRRKEFFYALPQSPQQYKQLLMAGGLDRYYQVAKCFRDEDLRADRQPEFTQVDVEMAFSGADEVQKVITDVVEACWAEHSKVPLYLQGHLKYDDAIARFGIDKPDLRSSLEIKRLPATAITHKEYPVCEALVLENVSSDIRPDQFASRMPFIVQVESESQLKQAASTLASWESWDEVYRSLGEPKPGSVVAFGDRQERSYENPTPLGRLRQLVAKPDTSKSVGAWVHRFPLFEPTDIASKGAAYPEYDTSCLNATHHPFTMVSLADYELLQSDPLACHGMHYDLVIDGVELGGGSTRIHDPALQRFVLEDVLRIKNCDRLFGHLLKALDTGCPPHAGLALGLDRMVAMLCGVPSVRDVIAFPKTMAGIDPMIGSPSRIKGEQLKPYHIRVS